jgi:hypothetical protein
MRGKGTIILSITIVHRRSLNDRDTENECFRSLKKKVRYADYIGIIE